MDSVVPGGEHVQLSGASTAAPAVANLAAKLLAIDPKLTPAEMLALIEQSSDPGDEPGIKLINPKNAVGLLRSRARKLVSRTRESREGFRILTA